jgi:hypothetical protein
VGYREIAEKYGLPGRRLERIIYPATWRTARQ